MPGRKELCGYGTSFTAQRWFSLDVCGCMGLSVSWSVHIYAICVLWLYVLPGSGRMAVALYTVLYLPMAMLALASLHKASTTDPGAVPLGARPFTTVRRSGNTLAAPKRAIRRCHKCENNFKPSRAHHDSVTGRCIVKMDHFCPWVGNAVGALNHKFFCLFLLYTALSCLVSLSLLVLRLIHCGSLTGISTLEKALLQEGNRGLLSTSSCRQGGHAVTLLAVASLVFFIFTAAMGVEQLDAISTGKGKIARLKQSVGASGSTEYATVTQEFNEMFGGTSTAVAWHWFVPTAIPIQSTMKQVMLGYEYNDSCGNVAYEEPDEETGEDSLSSSYANKELPMDKFSTRNRRNSRSSSEDEGIALVERSTKARLT